MKCFYNIYIFHKFNTHLETEVVIEDNGHTM